MHVVFLREALTPVERCVLCLFFMSTSETTNQGDSLTEERVLELIRSNLASKGSSDLKSISLDSKGLQIQLDLLVKIDSSLTKIQNLVGGHGETPINGEVLDAEIDCAKRLVKDRAKLLQIADKGGWAAVSNYQGTLDIGDNAEDSRKYIKILNLLSPNIGNFTECSLSNTKIISP